MLDMRRFVCYVFLGTMVLLLVPTFSQQQPAPGFSNLKDGDVLNNKQENALPDISGSHKTTCFVVTPGMD